MIRGVREPRFECISFPDTFKYYHSNYAYFLKVFPFLQVFKPKLCMQFSSLLCVTCSTHFILLYLVALIICSEYYENTNQLIDCFPRASSPMDMNENSIITIDGSIVRLRVPELSVATRVREYPLACDGMKNKIGPAMPQATLS
jgi:hypothetical protein